MQTDGNIRKVAAQNEDHSKQSDQSMQKLESLPLIGNAKWSAAFLQQNQSKSIAMLLKFIHFLLVLKHRQKNSHPTFHSALKCDPVFISAASFSNLEPGNIIHAYSNIPLCRDHSVCVYTLSVQ